MRACSIKRSATALREDLVQELVELAEAPQLVAAGHFVELGDTSQRDRALPEAAEEFGVGPQSLVLGDAADAGAMYDDAQKAMLPWYGYLFLQQGKPSTHLLALTSLDDATLKTSTPAVLSRLLARAKTLLGMQP